ncbi:hypothetical protein CEUSTIGMA_g8309.t1 [Chlamydomonas eustigma]|uniref:Peptidase A1 domain-containing protein n=1 Tax=Chlamydomonas eustigma TaxID=1157962 RepID=A0A250XCT7_9CHLO|nr:hypothetical protein CEUSTIGMA_g8309.t1 [Chlamydomonas eustigma]|eukprot:GAX80874.1 hypothetical protein CEUSTIGMA_g8309.t1 [Chlamydomonas eustigma]
MATYVIFLLYYVLGATLKLRGAHAASDKHPKVLTHLGDGMIAGGLYRKGNDASPARRRHRHLTSTFVPERLNSMGLGQYTVQFLLNGLSVNSVVDTGSGVGQLACTGTQINPLYAASVSVYNPSSATPPFSMISNTSAACSALCTQTQQCLQTPSQPGACQYFYAYADSSYVFGTLYSATMTFPSMISSLSFQNFLFGCSFDTSTNPYFFSNTNSLFGMDWQPLSFWSQMSVTGSVSDSLSLCLGNGGDAANISAAAQSGVIVFGNSSSIKVSGSSAGGSVVVATMLDSKNLMGSDGQLLLNPPSMWVTLSALNLVSASGASTNLPIEATNYYIVDSGTSEIILLQEAFNSLYANFCPSLNKLSNATVNVSCVFSANLFTVQVYGINGLLSKTALNNMFPNISFTLSNSTGPVNIRPSAYMILQAYREGATSSSSWLLYIVAITSAGTGVTGMGQGILGNAWMTDLLIQQTQSTRQLIITEVNSCDDVTYGTPSMLPPSPPLLPYHTPPPLPVTSQAPTKSLPPDTVMSQPPPAVTFILEQVTYFFGGVDYSTLIHSSTAVSTFINQLSQLVAAAANISIAYVKVVSITAGSVIVVTQLTLPTSLGLTTEQADQLTLSLASTANETFSTSFLTTFNITSVNATAQTSSSNNGGSQLSTSVIIGIAVAGGVVAASLGVVLVWFIVRRMRRQEVSPSTKAEYETEKSVEIQPFTR